MKNISNLLLTVGVVVFVTACDERTAAPSVTPNAAVTAALIAACPGLEAHARDIVLSNPERTVADATIARERGWTNVYNVAVEVIAKPSPRVANEFKAIGQTCTFSIDASKLDTVAVSKSACMAICKDKVPSSPSPYLAYFGVDGSEQLMR